MTSNASGGSVIACFSKPGKLREEEAWVNTLCRSMFVKMHSEHIKNGHTGMSKQMDEKYVISGGAQVWFW